MRKIFTLIVFIWSSLLYSIPYDLVICAVFQDEELFLKEWIEYHRLIGVDHFYLYNNQSKDSSLDILKPYIEQGLVELFNWDVETKTQMEYLQLLQVPTYMHALEIAKSTSKWAAFIDIDEFIAPIKQDDLRVFLKKYSKFGGIAINWQIFGTSDYDSLSPNELITENLIWKAPVLFPKNEYIKYVVQPNYVKKIHDPHHFEFLPGYYAVNTRLEPTKTIRGQPILIDEICINHYWFGTKNWFIYNKLPRREKWGMSIPKQSIDELISTCNQIEDHTLVRFSTKLRLAMEQSR